MRGIIICAVLACIAIIGSAILFTLNSSGGGPRVVPMHSSYEQRVADGYWKKGAEQPKVTFLEYLDFQCVPCRAASPMIDEAYTQTRDFVQIQNRIYPITLNHPLALQAARGAEAAGRQGKYWEMHDNLFVNQPLWEKQSSEAFKGTLDSYAKAFNLNIEQFHRDLKDATLDEPIDRDMAMGNKIPLQQTPLFFINGKVVETFPANSTELVEILKKAAAEEQVAPGEGITY
ncbi:MAG TPA: thioredoxin domain-containing protein [Verrucomicrobiae bacterium]|nr:thioredoxin domain-containing protein [Verrucomicrobiae bacterium]